MKISKDWIMEKLWSLISFYYIFNQFPSDLPPPPFCPPPNIPPASPYTSVHYTIPSISDLYISIQNEEKERERKKRERFIQKIFYNRSTNSATPFPSMQLKKLNLFLIKGSPPIMIKGRDLSQL